MARNCDKYKTYDEAHKAWREFLQTHKKCVKENDMTIARCTGGCSECGKAHFYGDCEPIWLMSETT